MMYVDDCLRSIAEYLVVPDDRLKLRTYNIQAMSFTPAEIAEEIRKHVPEFQISYNPDSRQQIGAFYKSDSILLVCMTKTR